MSKKVTIALLLILVAGTVALAMMPPKAIQASGGAQAEEDGRLQGDGPAENNAAQAAGSSDGGSPIPPVADRVSVVIDGVEVSYSDHLGWPYIDENRRTQTPVNQTMTSFGAEVSWDAKTRTARVEKDGCVVEVPAGKRYLIVNGEKQEMDTAASIRGGRMYLPAAHVLKAFGAEVRWDAQSRTVIVSSGGLGEGTVAQAAVHFIDVGQGDAILIDVGEFEILVDGGPRSAAEDVVSYIEPYIDGALDIVIATHQHEDHIGGLPAVLERYEVARVIDNGKRASSQIYQRYWNDIIEEGCLYENASGQNITIVIDDRTKLRLIGMEGRFTDANNNSLVACLESGQVKVLLTGDMEEALEKANLDKFFDVDVLKAGHHGSSTSSCQAFLEQTRPETVIISCATGNKYRHPNLAAMQRFVKLGAHMYGTQKSGSILLTTDGTEYQLSTEDELTLSDAGDRDE